MTEISVLVERVVREVIAELAAAPKEATPAAVAVSRAASDTTSNPPNEPPKSSARPSNELVLAGRVITLADLDDRLEGVRRLVVPRGAVVTPAVRDEIQRRRITLSFAVAQAKVVASSLKVTLVTLGRRFDPAGMIEAMQGQGAAVTAHNTDCLVEATDRLSEAIGQADTLGVLVTKYPDIGVCLANRHAGVRAIASGDPAGLDKAAVSLGANVLVLDPNRSSPYLIKRLAVDFCRGGVRECPEELKGRLS